MKRLVPIVLSVALISCASTPKSSSTAIQPPEKITMCPTLNQYGGFQGGYAELPNVAKVYARPPHLNDLAYIYMGPQAEKSMILASIILRNTSSSTITLARNAVSILGANGEVIPPLNTDQILEKSRGDDTKAKNMYENIGDEVLRKKYIDQISIKPREDGIIGIAFPLPLPPYPKIQVTINSEPVQLTICWAPPK